ncbi:MAG TPA: PAS domain S-box protein, partial [Deltaproteobacteria bacterium]|nr:PAS domain S-box protein [Deltaproteobacteria bacterium]
MRKNVMCDEELYRVVFETAGTAIIVIDEDTTILLANSHFEKLSGYSKEELEGRMSWTAFIAAEDVGRMKEYHEARRKDPGSAPQQYEFVFVDRSGGKRDILLNVSLIPGTGRSVASCMDITERKEAERFLKKSEQNYRNILESIQEAYYEVDLEGNFTFFNARAWQELGYPEGRLLGMNFRQYIHPDDVDKVFEVYHKVFVTGRPEGQVTFTVITHEGKAMPVETSVSLRKDETGRVVGFKGVVRDVSVRAAYEAALRESEERYRLLAENSSDVIWTLSLEGV